MIRHILLFQWQDEVSSRQVEQVRTLFLAFPDDIAGVTAVEWGKNDSQEGKNSGMSHCVVMTFRDEESRLRYLFHPQHDALKAVFSPLLRDLVVLDYTLQPDDVCCR